MLKCRTQASFLFRYTFLVNQMWPNIGFDFLFGILDSMIVFYSSLLGSLMFIFISKAQAGGPVYNQIKVKEKREGES